MKKLATPKNIGCFLNATYYHSWVNKLHIRPLIKQSAISIFGTQEKGFSCPESCLITFS